MANYKIFVKPSAAKELKRLPQKDLERIISKSRSLSEDPRPHGCEKLSAQERYRVRQGNYRIIYSIEDDKLVVYVVKIVTAGTFIRNSLPKYNFFRKLFCLPNK